MNIFEDYFHVLLLLHHLEQQSINRAKYLEQKRQNPFFHSLEYPTKASVDHPLPRLVPQPTCSFFQALPPPHLSLSLCVHILEESRPTWLSAGFRKPAYLVLF